MMPYSHRIELITPGKARDMLHDFTVKQARRNSRYIIATYAAVMAAGQWNEQNPEPLVQDSDGKWINGWHRLHAVIEAGMPIHFMVARGVHPDTFKTIDCGIPKSASFRLGIHKDTMAIVNCLLDLIHYGSGNKLRPPDAEVELVREYMEPMLQRFDEQTTPSRKARLTSASVRCAAILSAEINHPYRDEIYSAYTNLVLLQLKEAPISMVSLYRRLTEARHSRLEQFALAWRAFDPHRFLNTKIQIKDLPTIIHDCRNTALRELIDTIGEDDAEQPTETHQPKAQRQRRLDTGVRQHAAR